MDSRSDASASYPFPPTPRRAQQPYGNPPRGETPYGNTPGRAESPYGNAQGGPGAPYGNAPGPAEAPYGGAPVAAPPVWDDTPYATTPGNAPATSVDTVDTPADTPAGTGDAPAAGDKPQRKPGRDRYFDLLRAVALFRVVFYHLTGWAWLPIVFPSMGVMFALAGNLMARSLKRPAVQVIRGRMRRLLPPLWLLGAIGVTGMLLQGWGPDADGHPGWWWLHLTFWIVPLSDPPFAEGLSGIHGVIGADWAEELAGPLWYIRAYLWYVLLSPLILKGLRRLPWLTIFAPIALSAAFQFDYLELPGERIPSALTDFSTFGACWILGMAHQQGVLKRIPRYVVPSIAPAIGVVGLWYAFTHDFRAGNDLDSIPFAQALWSIATVMLLLHVSPSWSQWPRPLRPLDRIVTLLNSRAVTIYLWHNVCILTAATMWDRMWRVDWFAMHTPWLLRSLWPVLVITWILIASCIVWFGWAEDLAAKRKPQLWPDGSNKPRKARHS
ncbi:acyltransferase family protein [Streptomyces sp. XM83C]|jgi:peptidoglycan/LPS O-acetylase OafA/YrhL|uniref:acyltransferase family protein n=1 Tax=unclassified Streptomyces TaxID=2593676 RepID=UPI001FF7D39F|nr:acyltransferase [Streptomyces sp. XM83C]MCK1819070.1 acyltransferase family protein [Streptomyces sp. XM83C]